MLSYRMFYGIAELNHKMHFSLEKYWTVGLVIVLMPFFIQSAYGSCGGHIDLTTDDYTGNISTPNYPKNYTNWYQCIWVIQAPKDYSVVLDIGTVALQMGGYGGCADYIEVRNGSSVETVLYHECSGSGIVIPGDYRYLWIKFKSDASITNTGFIAHYTIESTPRVDTSHSPWVGCYSYDFFCQNKECVSWAYRCDGEMDCGCDQLGCDEYECDYTGWDETVKLGVGIGVGTFIFLCVFLGVGFLDICLKKYAEESYKKKMADQKKRAKQKKGEKAVENLAQSLGGSRRGSSLQGSGRRDSVATTATSSTNSIVKTPNSKTR